MLHFFWCVTFCYNEIKPRFIVFLVLVCGQSTLVVRENRGPKKLSTLTLRARRGVLRRAPPARVPWRCLCQTLGACDVPPKPIEPLWFEPISPIRFKSRELSGLLDWITNPEVTNLSGPGGQVEWFGGSRKAWFREEPSPCPSQSESVPKRVTAT